MVASMDMEPCYYARYSSRPSDHGCGTCEGPSSAHVRLKFEAAIAPCNDHQ